MHRQAQTSTYQYGKAQHTVWQTAQLICCVKRAQCKGNLSVSVEIKYYTHLQGQGAGRLLF